MPGPTATAASSLYRTRRSYRSVGLPGVVRQAASCVDACMSDCVAASAEAGLSAALAKVECRPMCKVTCGVNPIHEYCPTGEKLCYHVGLRAVCCPETHECCRRTDPQTLHYENECCAPGQRCCHGRCFTMPPGMVCSDDGPCVETRLCRGRCCRGNETCKAEGCCAPGRACGDHCCRGDELCKGQVCCPPDRVLSTGCCPEGQVACKVRTEGPPQGEPGGEPGGEPTVVIVEKCCPTGWSCASEACCPPGRCCENGVPCPQGTHCDQGICCRPGEHAEFDALGSGTYRCVPRA